MANQNLTSKQIYERDNLPYIYFLLRPMGRCLIPICIALNVSPNQVTTVSILFSIFGIGLLIFDVVTLQLTSILLLHFALVLDMLDGDLARKTNNTSQGGEFLDALGGYLRGGLFLPCMGIGLLSSTNPFIENLSLVPQWAICALGLTAGLSHFAGRLISLRYNILFEKPFRNDTGIISRITLNFEDKMLPFMLIGILTGYLIIPFGLFSAYYIISGLYIMISSYIQAIFIQTT